jgi:hypothetical protein
MTKLKIHWPWHKLEKGQGFFIPCLDTEALRVEGLDKALEVRIFNAQCVVCIKNGRIGLWFYRKPPSNPERSSVSSHPNV